MKAPQQQLTHCRYSIINRSPERTVSLTPFELSIKRQQFPDARFTLPLHLHPLSPPSVDVSFLPTRHHHITLLSLLPLPSFKNTFHNTSHDHHPLLPVSSTKPPTNPDIPSPLTKPTCCKHIPPHHKTPPGSTQTHHYLPIHTDLREMKRMFSKKGLVESSKDEKIEDVESDADLQE